MRETTFFFLSLLLLVSAPALRAEEGFSFTSPVHHPGKLDFHFTDTPMGSDANLMWWSPSIKGGFGLISPDEGEDTRFAGAFFRPLAAKPALGDLIVGVNGLDTPAFRDFEVQAEYRSPSRFAFGGGIVEREDTDLDVAFLKASYRGPLGGISSILTLQAQRVAEETSPGGYAALYNDELMFVAGDDGEQRRGTVGYVAPETKRSFRPAVEVLYVDNSTGDLDGPRTLFANATLGFKGGFLSHPARLGRAMGPTGLEFANPLGFLSPTWNRRLDTWEMGGLADFRVIGLETPNGRRTLTWQGVVFPFQFVPGDSFADGLFAGMTYTDRSFADEVTGVLAGLFRKVSFLSLSLEAEYDFETDDKRLNVGLIDAF